MANSLDPRIEVIREKYGLAKDDFWQLPQNKTWLVKHAALEIVAAKEGIVFEPPTIIEADGGNGVAAVCVTGHVGNRSLWSIGEASPKNSKNGYPWAMAEKRAIDRVVLKLVGIHGLVYSDAEGDFADEPATRSKAKSREPYKEMQDDIDSCMTLEDLGRLWGSRAFQDELKVLPADWQKLIADRKEQRKADLSGTVASPPQFDHLENTQ